MCDVVEGLRLELLGGIAKHASEAGVDTMNRSVNTHQRNAYCGVLERGTKSRLAVVERAPSLGLLGSGFRKQECAANVAVVSAPWRHRPAYPLAATVSMPERALMRPLL